MKKNRVDVFFEKSEQDRLAVKSLFLVKNSPDEIIAFHIQQMVEKLLKALLVFYKVEFKPSHDLFYLIEILEEKDPALADFYELAENLSPYAVLARYEIGFEIQHSEVKKLFEKALDLRKRIIAQIKQK